jgi:hypothetical protein
MFAMQTECLVQAIEFLGIFQANELHVVERKYLGDIIYTYVIKDIRFYWRKSA